jgi:uncharacterized protein YdcH (DUF465 family)
MAKAAKEALKRITAPEFRAIVREEIDYFRKEFNAKFDGLTARVEATNQRIDSLERSVNQRIDATNQLIEATNQRIDLVKDQVSELRQLLLQVVEVRLKPPAAKQETDKT